MNSFREKPFCRCNFKIIFWNEFSMFLWWFLKQNWSVAELGWCGTRSQSDQNKLLLWRNVWKRTWEGTALKVRELNSIINNCACHTDDLLADGPYEKVCTSFFISTLFFRFGLHERQIECNKTSSPQHKCDNAFFCFFRAPPLKGKSTDPLIPNPIQKMVGDFDYLRLWSCPSNVSKCSTLDA